MRRSAWTFWILLAVAALAIPASAQLFNLARYGTVRAFESPFNGLVCAASPATFTGQINAVNYDCGGQGVAYNHVYNNSNCNAGKTYRPDFTNFNTINDSGATLDIGCFVTVGDYLNYTVNVNQNGPFNLLLRAGSGNAGASWGIYLDNSLVTTITVPNTGGYQTFQTITSPSSFSASQGNHTLRVQCASLDSGSACGDLVFMQGAPVGSLACAVGQSPLNGTIPTEAANAGFSTCAANFDFSNSTYATLSNWADCGDTGATGKVWHSGAPGVQSAAPCDSSAIFQTTDQGSTVLDFHWDTSRNPGCTADPAHECNQILLQTVSASTQRNDFVFPNNSYIETTCRFNPFSVGNGAGSSFQNGGANECLYTWGTNSRSCFACEPGPVEVDLFEWSTVGSGNGGGNFQNHDNSVPADGRIWTNYGTGQAPPAGWSAGAYHKYGALTTSDGSTEVYVCLFVDDILEQCQGLSASSTPSIFHNVSWLIWEFGPQDGPGAANWDMLLKYARVYSCANWQTQACNGTQLFNSGGLIYYH